ncbi:MAG: hypothetical protein KJ579_09775 [Verrucomicrobia bacterium]|nr:hypothetical protein [Verrucomicrobiota bacterium]
MMLDAAGHDGGPGAIASQEGPRRTGGAILHIRRVIVFALALASASPAASTNDWSTVHIPILEVEVRCAANFDPKDPVVEVTYSNTSPHNAISVFVPATKIDQMRLVPDSTCDGVRLPHRDPEALVSEGIPSCSELIPPLAELTVTYRISWGYVVPPSWQRLTILPKGDGGQLAHHEFTFDPSGVLIEKRLYASTTIDAIRYSYCSIPRLRSLLEQTAWTNILAARTNRALAILTGRTNRAAAWRRGGVATAPEVEMPRVVAPTSAPSDLPSLPEATPSATRLRNMPWLVASVTALLAGLVLFVSRRRMGT